MRTYYLTFSKVFPSTHAKADINTCFEEKLRVEMLKEILADDVQFKEYELKSTFDFNNMYDADEEKAMSRCIYHVLTSDAIYLDHAWLSSKGCNLEYRAAKIYDKEIFEHDKL